jgi:DNA repair protein RadC
MSFGKHPGTRGRVILLHNHPSGNPAPNEEDIESPEARYRSTLGIKVYDRTSAGSAYLFADDG